MEYEIRPAKAGDGAGINKLRRMPGVFENILGIPSEKEKRNEEFILNMDENNHFFVAVTTLEDGQEEVIGCASLGVYANPRKRHSGGIGIMVHREYQGQGVGQKLMETLLDLADNWLMLLRVELSVFADNEKAIRLYKKMGFEEEGLFRMASIRGGKYCDELTMARIKIPQV